MLAFEVEDPSVPKVTVNNNRFKSQASFNLKNGYKFSLKKIGAIFYNTLRSLNADSCYRF